jgi:hypothetical protein
VLVPTSDGHGVEPGVLRAHNERTALRWAGPDSPFAAAADASWNAWLPPTDDRTRS